MVSRLVRVKVTGKPFMIRVVACRLMTVCVKVTAKSLIFRSVERHLMAVRFISLLALALFLMGLIPLAPGYPTLEAATARPKVGLVLGGGGARGLAHVGVLKVLEELRVPVDCIAGTSMGSIIGGLYASGMSPPAMDQTLQAIDWPQMFKDGPGRADLPFRTKVEQQVLLTDKGVGLKDWRVQLPLGLLQGQNLLLLLEELTLPAAEVRDFDQLPIPFRAVATDLATGEAVVLGDGELAKAMRASMSIPSALVPVDLDGKLLADGGMADNVPVDVARRLCRPDVIIAVDVGAPLVPTSELTSVLSITEQLTGFLTVRNARQQIATLGPRDILITPDLKDISSLNFERSAEAVAVGYRGAQVVSDRLSALSLSPEAYLAYRRARPALPEDAHPVIDFIRIENDTRLADQVIEQQLTVKPGDRLDPERLNRDLNQIYGMGAFQQVDYGLVREQGRTGLVVSARPAFIGTDRLNFGLYLGGDMGGDSMFNISAAYTKSQLNALGAEWRTFAQLGNNIILSTDFYQPLDADQEYYLDPFLSYEQYNLSLGKEGDEDVLGLRVRQFRAGLEMGRNLGHWGRLSLGLFYSGGSNAVRHGVPNGLQGDFNNSGFTLRLDADTLDSLDFPSQGYYANLRYRGALTTLSADEDFQTLLLDGIKPFAWGKSVLIPRLHLGATLSGEPGPEDLFLLGGFLNLSGYQPGDISGKYVGLAELVYLYRLNDASAAFSLPLYVGGSLEAGGGWESLDNFQSDTILPAGSLFLGADTPLGPAYLGAGFSEQQAALYLMLGKLWW